MRTVRGVNQDRRKCICDSCYTVFDTVAKVDKVYTNKGTFDVDDYKEHAQKTDAS